MNKEKVLAALQARRTELLGDLRRRLHAEGEAEQLALVNHLDETGDWAEASTENLQDIALLQHETIALRRLEDAIRRARSDAFGVCQECGEPIPESRLEAQLEATTCLQCQENIEQHTRHV